MIEALSSDHATKISLFVVAPAFVLISTSSTAYRQLFSGSFEVKSVNEASLAPFSSMTMLFLSSVILKTMY